MTSFRDLGLSEALIQTLDELGYEDPTAIQEQAIPELLAGHDVIGQAQTGTGTSIRRAGTPRRSSSLPPASSASR
jgi:superfamily II DNA/RNA helicase